MLTADLEYKTSNFHLRANINLYGGEIHALIGASGSGKSTLLRLICGLLKPSQGIIKCHDRELYKHSTNVFLPPQKRKIGLVFQDYALFEHLTVYQNIAYGVSAGNVKYVVDEWGERIGLSNKLHELPANLSGGERQRVALARTLASSPDVLLLDEPFSALNVHLRNQLRNDLRQLVNESGIPVLLATHDLEETRFIADRVSILANGDLLQSGMTSDVFSKPNSLAAAHALGWNNLFVIQSVNGNILETVCGDLVLNETVSSDYSYVAIPESAISQSNENGHFTGVLTHITSIDDTCYCDILINHKDIMRAKLDCGATTLEEGVEYRFSININQIVLVKD